MDVIDANSLRRSVGGWARWGCQDQGAAILKESLVAPRHMAGFLLAAQQSAGINLTTRDGLSGRARLEE